MSMPVSLAAVDTIWVTVLEFDYVCIYSVPPDTIMSCAERTREPMMIVIYSDKRSRMTWR